MYTNIVYIYIKAQTPVRPALFASQDLISQKKLNNVQKKHSSPDLSLIHSPPKVSSRHTEKKL